MKVGLTMIPKIKLEKYMAMEYKRHKEYRKKGPPWIILAGSGAFHLIMAVILSFTPFVMPSLSVSVARLDRTKGIDVVFMKELEPTPQIQIFEKTEKTVDISKAVTRRETQKVIQKSVPQKVETRPAWEAALLASKNSGGQSSPGSSGQQGKRGNPGDRPGKMSAGGIVSEDMITKTGGTGLRSDKIYDNMVIPAGKGSDFGAGGKDTSGFKFGVTENGRGNGRIDVAGRGGSGGTNGLGNEGPGQGLSTGTGKGTGGGKGTGIGLGDGSGKGGMGTGTGTGTGAGDGSGVGPGKGGVGDGGPGTGSYEPGASRNNPNPATRSSSGNSNTGSPRKTPVVDDKRAVIGREGFKADIGKDMAGPKVVPPEKTDNRDFGDALQEEINKDLHSLRQLHEDWQNSNIAGIPKALQITVVLNKSGSGLTVSSIDFHSKGLSPKISDDLTKRIKTWKFKSLSDGKDDPTTWPVKLNGRITWQ
jgi:hypothetical protein